MVACVKCSSEMTLKVVAWVYGENGENWHGPVGYKDSVCTACVTEDLTQFGSRVKPFIIDLPPDFWSTIPVDNSL